MVSRPAGTGPNFCKAFIPTTSARIHTVDLDAKWILESTIDPWQVVGRVQNPDCPPQDPQGKQTGMRQPGPGGRDAVVLLQALGPWLGSLQTAVLYNLDMSTGCLAVLVKGP